MRPAAAAILLPLLPLSAQVWDGGTEDPARRMVDGIVRYLEKQVPPKVAPAELARLLGVVDPRVPVGDLAFVSRLQQPALLASTPDLKHSLYAGLFWMGSPRKACCCSLAQVRLRSGSGWWGFPKPACRRSALWPCRRRPRKGRKC